MARTRRKNWLRRRISRLRLWEDPLGEAATEGPEVIELAGKGPVVQIYVGASPDLYRAVRVLIWSIMQVRDPERAYEIHLMMNLKGIDRKGWKTGYEGYCAYVAGMAKGRAIYCTPQMIFETDPAIAFDTTTDAILDLTDVRAAAQAGATIVTDTPWSFAVGRTTSTKTTAATIWRHLEADANAAGYMPFTKSEPTREFGELIELLKQMHDEDFFPGQRLKHHVSAVRELIKLSEAKTMLDYGAGKAMGYDPAPGEADDSCLRQSAHWPGVIVRCYDPGVPAFADIGEGRHGGVISTDVVEHLSPFDVPWVLDEMFSKATGFVFVIAACYPAIKTLPDGRNAHTTIQSLAWWRDQMALTGYRYPNVKWRIGCDQKGFFGKSTETVTGKGPLVDG